MCWSSDHGTYVLVEIFSVLHIMYKILSIRCYDNKFSPFMSLDLSQYGNDLET